MNINLAPRSVTSFKHGKTTFKGVKPEPFYADRARDLIASQEFGQDIDANMTLGEIAYVHAVWDTLENGNTSFMSAFHMILNGKVMLTIKLKWFTNIGQLRESSAYSQEEAIEIFGKARKSPEGANFRKWSFDGGETWSNY